MNAKVLLSVYLDHDIDEHIRVAAAAQSIEKAEALRRCLAAGMKSATGCPDELKATDARVSAPLILRAVYLTPKVDDRLRVEAFDAGLRKNDLVRMYVRRGMNLSASS